MDPTGSPEMAEKMQGNGESQDEEGLFCLGSRFVFFTLHVSGSTFLDSVKQHCQETEELTAKPSVTWHQFLPQPHCLTPYLHIN